MFDFRLEDWCNLNIIFFEDKSDFVEVLFGFEIQSSMFGSISKKIDRCIADIISIAHHVYGNSVNSEVRPDYQDNRQLIFMDEEAIFIVNEVRKSSIFSGSVKLITSVYKRSWWDPDEDTINEMVYSS